MKILLLGGTYFIGRRIASLLLQRGHDVSVLNRGNHPPLLGASAIIADRSDGDALAEALKMYEYDAVVDVSGQEPLHVQHVIGALSRLPRRIVYIGSGAVYTGNDDPFGEDSPTGRADVWGDYGLRKLECERLWREAAGDASSLLILRPPYLYGIGNPLDRESWFVSRISDGRTILIPDSADLRIQFLHVDDLAIIVATNLEKETPVSGVFNVAAPDVLTFGSLCELTGFALGKGAVAGVVDTAGRGLNARSFFPFRAYNYSLDVSNMKRHLLNGFGLLYPDTSAGWVETCVGISRPRAHSASSEAELTLLRQS